MNTFVREAYTMAKDKCIADFLFEQGFNTPPSERVARETLIAGGLTNSTKRNICSDKLRRAQEMLALSLFRACSDHRCQLLATLEAGTRRVVTVADAGCQICGGKKARRSVAWAAYRLGLMGINRVLVIGGTPAEHDEISKHVRSRGSGRDRGRGGSPGQAAMEFRFVDGTRPGRASEAAAALMRWADLVVIWANAPLKHSVSATYAACAAGCREHARLVYASCTGAAAMLDQVVSGIA